MVRLVESHSPLLDGKGEQGGAVCAALPVCMLNRMLGDALEGFYTELDRYTVADLVRKGPALDSMLKAAQR